MDSRLDIADKKILDIIDDVYHPQTYTFIDLAEAKTMMELPDYAKQWLIDFTAAINENSSNQIPFDEKRWLASPEWKKLVEHRKVLLKKQAAYLMRKRNANKEFSHKDDMFDLVDLMTMVSHPNYETFSQMVWCWTMSPLPEKSREWFVKIVDGVADDPEYTLDPPLDEWETSSIYYWFKNHGN
jgi:hypothetical protein